MVWHYKTLAVGWALKHGLHRSQKKMKLGPLTTEMRKRVFWSLYVLDVFSSAIVGLPKLLDDQQIDAEFPADLYISSVSLTKFRDDDYVTEMGFLPTPPGNFSIMSAALALFRASKILARLLSQVYSPQRVSLSTIQSIECELNDWRNGLPSYLRVDLPNPVPSSTNFHSHAPTLLLVHHWINTLIHRPILASTLLKKDETMRATASLAESSRAIISILSAMNEKKIQANICLYTDFTLFSSCISVCFPYLSQAYSRLWRLLLFMTTLAKSMIQDLNQLNPPSKSSDSLTTSPIANSKINDFEFLNKVSTQYRPGHHFAHQN